MLRKLFLLTLIALLCCEFTDEQQLEGPPNVNNKKVKNDKDVDNALNNEEDDEDGPLKIVPAPDLTQEREKRKGVLTLKNSIVLKKKSYRLIS